MNLIVTQTVKRTRRMVVILVAVAVVVGAVIVLSRPRWQDAALGWWSTTPGTPLVLTVGLEGGVGEVARASVTETATEVRVKGSTKLVGKGPRTSLLVIYSVSVQLSSPLNGRSVVDARSGGAVPEKATP